MLLYNWKISIRYKDSFARLVQTSSDHTVLNWFREFQWNNFSVQGASRSGRPSTLVNGRAIDAVRNITEDDPRSTYQQIEKNISNISSTPINSNIYDYLNLRKVCAR